MSSKHSATAAPGPLAGLKVVEIGAIGPVPMCSMLLADMGATVLRIERQQPEPGLGVARPLKYNLLLRNRPAMSVDLKSPEGVRFVLELVALADVLIEGFRPGTMERLGLGPDACLQRNPRLVYGRMTGWGQTGPYAQMAGHDLNYIALAGVLNSIGRQGQPPTPPLNLVGDFGGGALYLTCGVLAAVLSARLNGNGQVVDAAMLDGAASLFTSFFGMSAAGLFDDSLRGTNVLDSGAPFYDVYACSDGLYLSVAPIEAKFRRVFFRKLGISPDLVESFLQEDWTVLRSQISKHIAARTQGEWCAIFEGTDACVAPVLSLTDAPQHVHNVSRGTFIEIDGVVQPGVAPRFSGTPTTTPTPPEAPDIRSKESLLQWGMSESAIDNWLKNTAIGSVIQA